MGKLIVLGCLVLISLTTQVYASALNTPISFQIFQNSLINPQGGSLTIGFSKALEVDDLDAYQFGVLTHGSNFGLGLEGEIVSRPSQPLSKLSVDLEAYSKYFRGHLSQSVQTRGLPWNFENIQLEDSKADILLRLSTFLDSWAVLGWSMLAPLQEADASAGFALKVKETFKFFIGLSTQHFSQVGFTTGAAFALKIFELNLGFDSITSSLCLQTTLHWNPCQFKIIFKSIPKWGPELSTVFQVQTF